jgi:hypothetical protein
MAGEIILERRARSNREWWATSSRIRGRLPPESAVMGTRTCLNPDNAAWQIAKECQHLMPTQLSANDYAGDTVPVIVDR